MNNLDSNTAALNAYELEQEKLFRAAEIEQDNYLETALEPDEQILDDLSAQIMEHLSDAPILLDELLRACSYSSSIVMSALLELDLAGKITRHPGNKIST